MPFKTGDLLDGKYRLLERIGAGGMGEVYKAEHVLLGTTRVIKVVRPQIAENPEAHERFLREARLATRVHHQNVATLHDFAALPDGAHYMVWELIDGENVGQTLRTRGTLPPHEAVRIAVQVLHGLDAIHRACIVHRDISPENLMVTRGDREVKIIDLGVAKGGETDPSMTRTGMFVGKLRYASPEHLGMLDEKERIDGRADLYSLAIVLYEMLAGRPPFEATSPHQYYIHHSREHDVVPLDLAPIPQPLRPVLARALERDRNRRFATAGEFAAALEQIRFGDDTPTQVTPMPAVIETRRKPSYALPLVIGTVVVLAILAVLTTRPWSSRETTTTTATTQTVAVPTASTPPSQTTVVSSAPVVSTTPTATQPPPEPKRAETTRQPAPPQTTQEQPPPVEPKKVVEAPPPSPSSSSIAAYVDGKGDSSHNEEALAYARKQLSGTTKIAIEASGDADLQTRLAQLLKNDGLAIADGADVVVRFNGSVQRQRFGRKVRSGTATISRHGRVVFRYELPAEEYRVGDNPAEAFARVAGDLFR